MRQASTCLLGDPSGQSTAGAEAQARSAENRGGAEAGPLPWGADPTRRAAKRAPEPGGRRCRPATNESAVLCRSRQLCEGWSDERTSDPSRHTNETNSVTGAEAGNDAVSEPGLPTVEERLAEFREEYEDRARLRLTEVPGQRLRASLTEATYTEVPVSPQIEADEGTSVYELERRVPLTWEEAVEQLLRSHEEARKTTLKLACGYEGDADHAVFYKDAVTSWMREYQKRYFAELKGWVRETIGGTRPSGGECAGEFGDPSVVLLTRTASSIPEGRRASPVDHCEALRDGWEPAYHTLRNTLRRLGFDSDQWDYYRKEEPHTSERGRSTGRRPSTDTGTSARMGTCPGIRQMIPTRSTTTRYDHPP